MTTRNWLAMGLTIALTLIAAALWLQMDSLPDPRDAVPAAAHTATPSPDAPLPESAASTTGVVPPAGANLIQADVPARRPRTFNDICKWGYEIRTGPDGDFESVECAKSQYWTYTTETLEIMAYGDADAASVLAYRLRHVDYPRALKLALRAAALSGGDVSTLISAINWRPTQNANGEPDLSGIAQAYVLHSLIARIRNGGNPQTTPYTNLLRQLAPDPDATQQQLDEVVDRLFEDAREIELRITGSSTIGGDNDV